MKKGFYPWVKRVLNFFISTNFPRKMKKRSKNCLVLSFLVEWYFSIHHLGVCDPLSILSDILRCLNPSRMVKRKSPQSYSALKYVSEYNCERFILVCCARSTITLDMGLYSLRWKKSFWYRKEVLFSQKMCSAWKEHTSKDFYILPTRKKFERITKFKKKILHRENTQRKSCVKLLIGFWNLRKIFIPTVRLDNHYDNNIGGAIKIDRIFCVDLMEWIFLIFSNFSYYF